MKVVFASLLTTWAAAVIASPALAQSYGSVEPQNGSDGTAAVILMVVLGAVLVAALKPKPKADAAETKE